MPRIVRWGLGALAASAAAAALAGAPEPKGAGAPPLSPPEAPPAQFETPAPPFELGLFPCTQCHKAPGNPARRELGFHDEVQPLHHGARWCLDCHDNANRDVLHLTNGDPVPFAESYRLCGQCHGDKFRDWRVGVHGKRVGMWDGKKTYFLCVHCHNPHAPRFTGVETKDLSGVLVQRPIPTPTKPEPRPRRPEEAR
ncbi:MAG TPA: cytochrome c3 family protein [Anaeromyxobacteraceae bacterium]|jgi:hypothetical protein